MIIFKKDFQVGLTIPIAGLDVVIREREEFMTLRVCLRARWMKETGFIRSVGAVILL